VPASIRLDRGNRGCAFALTRAGHLSCMTYALEPSDMTAASAVVSGASADARGATGADALATLAAALPGTSVAAYLPELGGLWQDGITKWCDNVDDLSEGLDSASADGTSVDSAAGGFFTWLTGGS
jgi:hypothetical protein